MQRKRHPETNAKKQMSEIIFILLRCSVVASIIFFAFIPTINSLVIELVMVAEIVLMLNGITKILKDVLFSSHQPTVRRTAFSNNRKQSI